MKHLLIALALVVCAVAVRAEEESALANVETVEPTFVEADASTELSPLFQLPKKLQKTTVEPRYYGEKPAPKKYISPEYRDPKPVKLSRHERKNRPVLFTSHYFSPLPKRVNGKKLRVSRQKRGRSLVPFRATVQTPVGLLRSRKGFTEAELWDGRLPNKYDDPRQNMKKTKAPAPLSLLESMAAAQDGLEADTTDEAEAEAENAPVPPPFQHDEGEQVATIVESAEGFFDQNYQPPTWKDEDASVESELIEADASASEKAAAQATRTHLAAFMESGVEIDQSKLPRLVPVAPHVSAEEAVEQYNDLSAFLDAEDAKNAASFVEVAEEADDEVEDEEEAEDEDEAEEESEDESEEEADEEADDEAEEEIVEEVSLMETAAAADEEDSVDAEMDEMAQNEAAAAQVDMDATSDEAAMSEGQEITETTVEEVDSDEQSSAEEADTAEEEVTEDEAVEDAEVADAVSLMETAADADEEVDTLLSEVDAHLSSDSDAETEADADAEGSKGTPGSRIAAGQTWEEHQNERLNAMEQQLAAEKAATPKVQAQVVSAEQLSAVDAEHQVPAYDSAEAAVETVEPELLVEASAQAVLKSKIAQLKAINRS